MLVHDVQGAALRGRHSAPAMLAQERNKLLVHFLYSRIPPVENGPVRLDFFSTGFFWSFFLFSVQVDFMVFVLLLGAVGVREYCCTAGEIGWQLCASRFLREPRHDEPSSQRVGGFGLSRKPP